MRHRCSSCGHEFKKYFGIPGRPIKCPKCGSKNTTVISPM